MKGVSKFIIYTVLILILAIGGVLLYQTFGVSEDANWEDKDELELQQEHSADSVVNSNSIFD